MLGPMSLRRSFSGYRTVAGQIPVTMEVIPPLRLVYDEVDESLQFKFSVSSIPVLSVCWNQESFDEGIESSCQSSRSLSIDPSFNQTTNRSIKRSIHQTNNQSMYLQQTSQPLINKLTP